MQNSLLCVGLGTLGARAAVDDGAWAESPPTVAGPPAMRRRPWRHRVKVVTDFRRGEDLLDVAIFAAPGGTSSTIG